EITIAQPTVRVFPNPAQGSATLSYALPQAGRAQLRIYAPDGSLVRTLVDGRQPAGRYALRWDGRDNGGRPAAAGMYFYQLDAGEASPSGRLILTR
ncbi:MAG: T9SS type A sorting domain-containing protein, partial [Candidatus Eisenbacteria bacterium]|nr:T9SS type A sorting domain-containing protein [Candidatus Eisenbacteria bacterium]